MIKWNIGEKIKSLTKKTIHVIESIETIAGKTVIFTKDTKCFPVEDVKEHYDSFVSEYFIKVFSGQEPTIEDQEKMKKIFSAKSK